MSKRRKRSYRRLRRHPDIVYPYRVESKGVLALLILAAFELGIVAYLVYPLSRAISGVCTLSAVGLLIGVILFKTDYRPLLVIGNSGLHFPRLRWRSISWSETDEVVVLEGDERSLYLGIALKNTDLLKKKLSLYSRLKNSRLRSQFDGGNMKYDILVDLSSTGADESNLQERIDFYVGKHSAENNLAHIR